MSTLDAPTPQHRIQIPITPDRLERHEHFVPSRAGERPWSLCQSLPRGFPAGSVFQVSWKVGEPSVRMESLQTTPSIITTSLVASYALSRGVRVDGCVSLAMSASGDPGSRGRKKNPPRLSWIELGGASGVDSARRIRPGSPRLLGPADQSEVTPPTGCLAVSSKVAEFLRGHRCMHAPPSGPVKPPLLRPDPSKHDVCTDYRTG